SVDTGKTWSLLRYPAGARVSLVRFADAATGYLSTFDGTLYRPADGGLSWTFVSSPPFQISDLVFAGGELAYALGEWGMFMKTRDDGASWTAVPNARMEWMYGVHFFDESHGIVAGLGFQETRDGGATWTLTAQPPYYGSFPYP